MTYDLMIVLYDIQGYGSRCQNTWELPPRSYWQL